VSGAPAAARSNPIYLDADYSPAERAADLVSRMTLEEKASQMNSSQAAAIPRLGVAAYGWWNEAAHGVAREQTTNNSNPPILTNTTSYPVSLSLGSTWNPSLMYREATMISDEAREVVRDNRLDLDFWSPTVNLGRDPRWGRSDETFSEDPMLTARIASQFVNGLEGKSRDGEMLPGSDGYLKAVATLKHFAANNSEYNRLDGSSDMDERTLREYYTAQFRRIIEHADPGSMMSAYNEVNGVPASANVHLLDRLARQTFGFGGYVTSDCDAVYEMQAGHHWVPPGTGEPVDEISRSAYANSAGTDLNCNQGYHDEYNYANTIPRAVAQGTETATGTYDENDVDVSVTRLFTARIRTGEFDAEQEVPWVREARERLEPGTWTNDDSNDAVTQTPERLEMARKAADQSIVLLQNRRASDGSGKVLPLRVPARKDFDVAVIGRFANPDEMYLGGYSSIQGPAGEANEVNGYEGIKKAVEKVNPHASVDYLPGTVPGDLGTVDDASVKAAADYDAVIVYAGTDDTTGDEGADRSTLKLPGAQDELINRVAARNPHTAVYIEAIGQVDVTSFVDDVPAVLWSSYNGQRKGEALADVVLGRYNPSGHLPFTWYRSERDLAPIGDYSVRPDGENPGRTYMYYDGPVSYPFGHGLSYTRTKLSHLRVSRRHVGANGHVRVSARVTNVGHAAGDQVAQLYVTTPDAPAALERPVKRLEGFEKVSLRPGRTKTVTFDLDVADLAFFDDATGRYSVDDGRYGLQLASSAGDVEDTAGIRVHGHLRRTPSVVTSKPVMPGDAARGVSQRVQFPRGTRVDPQLTVALNDESVFGYASAGRSTPLPNGMRARFRSNRPSVVRVSRSGTLRTVGDGVATVKATVSYRGRSASGTFVVHVG
ncbi:MAG: glycoside hydrolase family 3 C-terminal domain-containing protein, partial [Nocardioidaceae bacterium]